MRSRVEPATTRIKRSLEPLSSYSFTLYYIKGKDMILSDFLSRQKTDDSNPHKIIPISFSLRKVLHECYYKISDMTRTVDLETDKYMLHTRSQAKSSGVKVPEVHGVNKGLIPRVKLEKNSISSNCMSDPSYTSLEACTSHTIYRPKTTYKCSATPTHT